MNDTNIEHKQSAKLNLKTWLKLMPFFKRLKSPMIWGTVWMLALNLIEASFPLFTRHAVDNFVIPQSTAGMLPFTLLFITFVILLALFVFLFAIRIMAVEMKMGYMLREDCFVHLQKLPLSYHNTNPVGFLIARVMNDTERISSMVAWGFSNFIGNAFFVLASVVFMFILDPRLAAILILIIPVAGVIAWLFQRRIIIVNRNIQEINSRISAAYNEGITGSKTSKTLVIEDLNIKEFGKLSDNMQRQSVRASRLNAMMLPLVLSLGTIAVSIVLYSGGYMVASDILDFGILAAFITYAISIIEPIVSMAGTLSEMMGAQVGIERVTSLLNEPETIMDSPAVVEKYGDTFNPKFENWEPIHGRITFDDVTFMYPDGDENVLENFSLDIPPGTTVAIVGETGAGKSTIVNLACRFYEPTKGRVLIDGKDSRDRSQLWLHSSLGYVLQDPHLFSGTIMENIRYGRLDATDDEVIAAAKLVSADLVAERMQDGYDSEVGESGDMLSTGEKQLISFARAVLADPPIFVLDEATSSIDTETELLIQSATSHMLKERTSFVIAHRLSTIVRADIILVVESGKIVERGTHQELLALDGYYSKLFKAMRVEEEVKKDNLHSNKGF